METLWLLAAAAVIATAVIGWLSWRLAREDNANSNRPHY